MEQGPFRACFGLMVAPTTRVPFEMRPLPVAVGAGLTHRGLVREVNEDTILTDPEGVLWSVADGMGGYGHGDVASDRRITHFKQ